MAMAIAAASGVSQCNLIAPASSFSSKPTSRTGAHRLTSPITRCDRLWSGASQIGGAKTSSRGASGLVVKATLTATEEAPATKPEVAGLKADLLVAVAGLGRGHVATKADEDRADSLAMRLEAVGDAIEVPKDLDKLQGRWRLVFSSGFNTGSLGGQRPGPSISRLPLVSIGSVYQRIHVASRELDNIVDLNIPTGSVGVLSASPVSSFSARATFSVSRSALAATSPHWQLGSGSNNGPAGPSSSPPSLRRLRTSRGWVSRRQQARGNEKGLHLVCAQVVDSLSSTALNAETKPVSSKFVLVLGATGGVGQLVVASLLEKGFKVRALLRSAEKAKSLFGDKLGDQLEIRTGDTRQREALDEALFEGITHVINATGTTAFPSKRWDGDNGPEQTDWIGVRNVVDALPPSVQRIVLVSSIGVTKSDELPWNIMNLFGVLKYKKMGEDHLRNSGIPFTIIRPGRLTDGPYTSYDLNTLLQATAGTRRDVILGQGDKLVGEASRLVVAEACIHVLDLDCTKSQTYELKSVEGDGPGKDAEKWASIFQSIHSSAV